MHNRLPEWFDTLSSTERSPHLSPESNLITAVLARAIIDLHAPAGQNKNRVKREALGWLLRRYKAKPPPMSFEWVCGNLNLDATHIRRAALAVHFEAVPRIFRAMAG